MTQHGAILGLDPGQRRIGVALAVAGASLALPLTVLVRDGDWLETVAALVREHGVTDVVVGLPISLKGAEGPAAASARNFAGQVGERLGMRVHLVDERLSTVAAGRALAEAGTRGRRVRRTVDSSAAAIILQAYLDGQPGVRPDPEGVE